MMNGPLHGKACLVTGASGGSGLLAARALAQTGAELFLSGLHSHSLKTAAQNIKTDFPVKIDIHPGNPAQSADAETLATACARAHILITCTGNLPHGGLDDVEDQAWRKSWESAVFAPLNISREMLGHMTDQGRGLVVIVIDCADVPDGQDVCATVAGGALKAFVTAQGQVLGKGIKILGLTTGRTLNAEAFSMAISNLACAPERFPTGSLFTVEDVNVSHD